MISLPEGSIYGLLAEHGAALFGDEYFADLFKRSAFGPPDGAGPYFRETVVPTLQQARKRALKLAQAV